jgi:cell division protein FtsQ
VRRRSESHERFVFDPKAQLERLRKSLPFRYPMLTLTLAFAGLGALAGVLAGGYIGKTETAIEENIQNAFAAAGFAVHDVAITGNERTSSEMVQAALGVATGRPIFAIDPDAARRRLLKLPWIAEAEVKRQYPDTIAVRVVEKRPFAIWRKGGELVVIERSGAVITKDGAGAFRLPVLIGTGAPEAAAPFIDALGAFKTVSARLRTMERVGARRWDLLLTDGVIVKLPEQGWEAELAELERLVLEKGVLDRDVEIIDLRYPDRYVFGLHNGESRPMRRDQRA